MIGSTPATESVAAEPHVGMFAIKTILLNYKSGFKMYM